MPNKLTKQQEREQEDYEQRMEAAQAAFEERRATPEQIRNVFSWSHFCTEAELEECLELLPLGHVDNKLMDDFKEIVDAQWHVSFLIDELKQKVRPAPVAPPGVTPYSVGTLVHRIETGPCGHGKKVRPDVGTWAIAEIAGTWHGWPRYHMMNVKTGKGWYWVEHEWIKKTTAYQPLQAS